MMKHALIFCVLILVPLIHGQDLPINLDLEGETNLIIQIRNPSNEETLALLKWNSPLMMDNPLSFAVFDETTQEALPYHGRLYKRLPTPNPIEDLLVIRPGQVHETVVDLTEGYDFESDHRYTVMLGQQATIIGRFFVENRQRDEQVAAIFEPHATNALLRFSVGSQWPSSATRAVDSRSKVTLTSSKTTRTFEVSKESFGTGERTDGTANCSNTTANNLVAQAVVLSRTMSANAASYATASNCVNRYYTDYFGNYTASRFSTFSNCITAISSNLADPFGAGNPWNVNCYPSGCGSGSVVAYVSLPDPNHIINLCSAFWSMADDWTYDSKAGTFIHEMSHLVCGTNDYVYGEGESRVLAATNPDQALDNADNYEYFSENHPEVCTFGTSTGTTTTTTTQNNGGGGGSSSSGCFDADATVLVRQSNGQLTSKTLRQLQVGDEVESVDQHLNKMFSPVYFLLHNDDEQPVEMLEITSFSGLKLRLTPHHLLLTLSSFSSSSSFSFSSTFSSSTTTTTTVRADSLSIGDLILVSSGEEQTIRSEKIVSIANVMGRVRLPLTENDRIVVDGIVASVFAHSESLYRPLTLPMKLIHSYFPSVLQFSPVKIFVDAVVRLTDLIESSSFSLLYPLSF